MDLEIAIRFATLTPPSVPVGGYDSRVAHHSNTVVREKCMHLRHFISRHVTADTVRSLHRTRRSGVICGGLHRSRLDMASQAFLVVGCRIGNERFMGVVTSRAGQPGIAISPATALLQAIGRKPNHSHPLI